MQLGYYWGFRLSTDSWRIVQVVDRLTNHVLDGGYAVLRADYSEFYGPLTPPAAGSWCRACNLPIDICRCDVPTL